MALGAVASDGDFAALRASDASRRLKEALDLHVHSLPTRDDALVVPSEDDRRDHEQQLRRPLGQMPERERHLLCHCWRTDQGGAACKGLGSHCEESWHDSRQLVGPRVADSLGVRMEVQVLGLG